MVTGFDIENVNIEMNRIGADGLGPHLNAPCNQFIVLKDRCYGVANVMTFTFLEVGRHVHFVVEHAGTIQRTCPSHQVLRIIVLPRKLVAN